MKYKTIAAGGTFDHLHKGHKAFLLWLFEQAENVLLGITTDTFSAKTKKDSIQTFALRKNTVQKFLKEHNLLNKTDIVAIDDMYGPLLETTTKIDCIGATDDTYANALEINKKRHEKGLSKLQILKMPLVMEENKIISSSSIRNGVIGTDGKMWVKDEWKQYAHVLPKDLREELHKPFGNLLKNIPKDITSEKTITVGDVTTKLFLTNNIQPHLAIVDFIVERQQVHYSIEEFGFALNTQIIQIKNSAGHIGAKVWDLLEKSLQMSNKTVIQVYGEEDLLVLPCILLSPLGYHIFYGQPQIGLVHIEVTEQTKKHAYAIMTGFLYI